MTVDELVAKISRSTQHRHLYHFTDKSNFSSIAAKGLLSKAKMREEGWWPDATGGNQLSWDLDKLRGIDGCVSLCLTTNHPMKYLAQKDGRLPEPRYLAIKPAVLKLEGVRIAFGVANANEVEILPIADALEKLDVEVLYTRTDWTNAAIQQRLTAAEKLEVLVPGGVPRNLIAGTV